MKSLPRGFTLIELLVVIAIIAILAAILFPVFAKAREKARQSSCLNNQRQIAVAILMYAQDHDETLPDHSSVWPEINVDRNILMCPTKGKKVANAYVYHFGVSSLALGEITDPSGSLLTMDGQHAATTSPVTYDNVAYTIDDVDARHSNKFVATFVDGHVDVLSTTPNQLLVRGGLVLWLKADSFVSINDGAAISSWQDMSGRGNTMTAIRTTNQPKYTRSAQNNLPAISFGSTGCGLLKKNFQPGLAVNDSFSIISCFRHRDTASANWGAVFCAHKPGNTYDHFNMMQRNTSGGASGTFNNLGWTAPWCNLPWTTSVAARTGFNVVTWSADARQSVPGVKTCNGQPFDGNAFTNTTTPQEISLQEVRVGGRWCCGAELNSGALDIAELLFFTPPASGVERALVENYLQMKYAIP
jgi:prepilin-type N-terminal cleavage/methylation domain-containing protein/prepilin-type processing-associated H-X9-DG protein